MPSVSKAQHNYFEGVAHGDIPARPSTQKAAKDFVAADKGRDLKALPVHTVPHPTHTVPEHIHAALRSHHARRAANIRHGKGYPKGVQ